MSHRVASFSLAVVAGLLVLVGCGPQASGLSARGEGSSESPKTPKLLRIGLFGEPDNIEGFGGTRGAGASLVKNIVHNYLAVQTEHLNYVPQLAAELPSIEKGTWVVLPDGRMDTTWRLRPNITWHDGTGFTSEDLVFGFTARQDPAVPQSRPATAGLMEAAEAPDPLTFVVHWSQPYIHAEQAVGLSPLPSHLLEQLYLTDQTRGKETFAGSQFFRGGFVGLGPYRLTKWEQGSFMEFVRFDGYFLGRPPLDRVVAQFFADPNALASAILAEAVDVVVPPGLDIETALAVKQRWDGTGNIVRFDTTGRFTFLEIQYRPEYARPNAGMANADVRRALYHALDRRAFVEQLYHGLPVLADSWAAPNDADRPALEDSIPKFPFDPARAQQLLGQAGWVRAADGVLANTASGERFELGLRASQTGGTQLGKDRQLAVIADFWKGVGVEPTLDLQAIGTNGDRGYEATRPGVWLLANTAANPDYLVRLQSRNIGTEATNYAGQNLGGYVSPRVDSLIDQYNTTIDAGARLDLNRALLQAVMGEVVVMPLYLDVNPVLMLNGINPSAVGAATDYRFFDWDWL